MGLPRSNVVPAHKPDFYGSVSLAEGPEVKTVVSFPGQYEDDWECLVRRSGERTQLERTVKQPLPSHTPYYKAGSTSCIFLPKGSPFHGSHPPKPDGSGKCWCEDLYGEVQDFGCMWFTVWQTSLQNAVDKKHTLVVVYKAGQKGHGKEGLHWPPQVACTKERRDDAGLGVSQRGETAWLLKQGHNFIEEDINDYRRRLALDFWSELPETVHRRREQLQQELLGLMKRMHMLSLTAPLNGGLSPAHFAAGEGHVPVLQLLYDLGGAARSTLTATDDCGVYPAHQAALNGHTKALQLLALDETTRHSLFQKNASGETPGDWGHDGVKSLLAHLGSKIHETRDANTHGTIQDSAI